MGRLLSVLGVLAETAPAILRGVGLWPARKRAGKTPAPRRRTVRVQFLFAVQVIVAFGLAPAGEPDTSPVPLPEILQGKVVEVTDGDSFTLMASKTLYEVDLAGIDAPEVAQPFGAVALESLSARILHKTVDVLPFGTRQTTTIGGAVYCGGCVNTDLVREGMAWYDRQFGLFPALATAELEAREQKLGLWKDAEPMAPWDWRKAQAEKAPAGDRAVASATNSKRSEKTPAKDITPADADSAAAAGPTAQQGSHWLTLSSGVRHNSSCKYYKTSKGRPCSANDGRPCKVCGG